MTGTITITPCPQCQEVGDLNIIIELVAKPVGSWSLAGTQIKYSAQRLPILRCDHCTFKLVGKFDGDSHATFSPPKDEEES